MWLRIKYETGLSSSVSKTKPGLSGYVSKTKRGLSGFANGWRISAFPDTGSTRNVVSEAFVRRLNLDVKRSPCKFKLGNSQSIKSIGELPVVDLRPMVPWLMDSSRHSELRLGIFGMRHRYDEHHLRCTPHLQLRAHPGQCLLDCYRNIVQTQKTID